MPTVHPILMLVLIAFAAYGVMKLLTTVSSDLATLREKANSISKALASYGFDLFSDLFSAVGTGSVPKIIKEIEALFKIATHPAMLKAHIVTLFLFLLNLFITDNNVASQIYAVVAKNPAATNPAMMVATSGSTVGNVAAAPAVQAAAASATAAKTS